MKKIFSLWAVWPSRTSRREGYKPFWDEAKGGKVLALGTHSGSLPWFHFSAAVLVHLKQQAAHLCWHCLWGDAWGEEWGKTRLWLGCQGNREVLGFRFSPSIFVQNWFKMTLIRLWSAGRSGAVQTAATRVLWAKGGKTYDGFSQEIRKENAEDFPLSVNYNPASSVKWCGHSWYQRAHKASDTSLWVQ